MNSLCYFRLAATPILIAAACSHVLAAGPGSPATSPAAAPASAGMDAAVLANISGRMEQFVEAQQIAGAVTLVARPREVVLLEAVGHADIESGRPMTRNSLFAIASMTKPVTATALMILQDEGRLSVGDRVSKYIPEFERMSLGDGTTTSEITLRHLLTHTSGLGGSQRTEPTLEDTVEKIARQPLQFAPGARWQYSPGLNVCGRIVEIVSQKPYDEFLRSRIFEPLQMTDTTFQPSADQRRRLATLYQPGADRKSLERASHWLVEDPGHRAANPSGGLFSTASEMARFYQMILGGGQLDGRRIVSEAAVQEMTRVQTGDLATGFTPGNGWGLGWCIVRQPQGVTEMLSPGSFGHGGAFGTQGWVDPEREMIFVLMIQRTGFGNSDASDIRGAFQKMAVQAIAE